MIFPSDSESDTGGKPGARMLACSSLGARGLELSLVGLGEGEQGKQTGGGGKRKGRRTGGPTLGLPPVPTGVLAAFMTAVYRGSEPTTRQSGPSWQTLNPWTKQ